MDAVAAEIKAVKAEIKAVEEKIEAVEEKIEEAQQSLRSCLDDRLADQLAAQIKFLREKETRLRDEKMQLRKKKTLLLEEDVKLLEVPSFPLMHVSYSQLLGEYEAHGCINDTEDPTWRHAVVREHPDLRHIAETFDIHLQSFLAVAKKKKWVIKVCQKEPDGSYESGATFLQGLTKMIYSSNAFRDVYQASLSRKGALYRCNTSANTSTTAPDLAFCGLKFNIDYLENVYRHVRIVWEYKNDASEFRDAMGEVLDRSQRSRKETKAEERVIFGAATTGLAFRPMIIVAQGRGGMVVRGPPRDLGELSGTECIIDTSSPAFQEVLFQAFALLCYQVYGSSS